MANKKDKTYKYINTVHYQCIYFDSYRVYDGYMFKFGKLRYDEPIRQSAIVDFRLKIDRKDLDIEDDFRLKLMRVVNSMERMRDLYLP